MPTPTPIAIKRINNEIKKYAKDNFLFPNCYLRPKPDNILHWYFIIYGLKDHGFDHGYYLGEIILPHDYPLGAPDIKMITPSGRFQTNKKLCTTFTSYHSSQFVCVWNVLTMVQGFISFMTDDTFEGIGSIKNSMTNHQKYAQQSIAFNMNNKVFQSIFPDFLDQLKPQLDS